MLVTVYVNPLVRFLLLVIDDGNPLARFHCIGVCKCEPPSKVADIDCVGASSVSMFKYKINVYLRRAEYT